jgi:hypothetical protein
MVLRLRCMATVFAGVVAMAALSAQAAEPNSRGRSDRQAFLGLWEGIDLLDGSTVHFSITDIERDGDLEMVLTESFFTFCARLGENYSQGRGIITGQGRVVNSVLKANTRFTCINDEGVPGKPEVGPFDYPLKDGGRILVVPGVDAETPDVLLHRVAR